MCRGELIGDPEIGMFLYDMIFKLKVIFFLFFLNFHDIIYIASAKYFLLTMVIINF